MYKMWLYLYSETFLWTKGKSGLIYNSITGKGYRFTNNKEIVQIVLKLQDPVNLYCIEIHSDELENKYVLDFVNKILKSKSGNLKPCDSENSKPIAFPPILNLQSDVERLRIDSPELIGENVMDNLIEVFIHINKLDSSVKLENLEFFKIKKILESIINSSVYKIHICGEKLMAHPEIELITEFLDKLNLKKCFHINPGELIEHRRIIKYFSGKQFQITIELNDLAQKDLTENHRILLKEDKVNLTWDFAIHDQKEFENALMFIEKYGIKSFNIHPVFNGSNLQFFEDFVFLTEKDILRPNLKKREIFAHQALNTNDFGKLHITSDGKIFANLSFPSLGTIEDDIRHLIFKEMDQGTTWRRIRDMKPCCDCVYQWLCPSPSNYEIALDKPNLCHIRF